MFFFTLLPVHISAGYMTTVASTTTSSNTTHMQQSQAVPLSSTGTNKRSQHFVKSNSETDAHQLEKVLEEQLQFGEGEERKLQ